MPTMRVGDHELTDAFEITMGERHALIWPRELAVKIRERLQAQAFQRHGFSLPERPIEHRFGDEVAELCSRSRWPLRL
jgi:hypothetical protein